MKFTKDCYLFLKKNIFMFKKHLSYLEQLQANNTREWFHENKNKETYDFLRKELLEITAWLIDFLDQYTFLDDLNPRKCIFRINRDARFSKNKDPYKTNFGIEIAPWGRRSGFPSFYIHIEPGNHSFIGGGLYMPGKNITTAIRKWIDIHGKQFQKIIKNTEIREFHSFNDRALKTVPRGYSIENPQRELLRKRDWIMSKPLWDTQLTNKNTIDLIKTSFAELAPFVGWLEKMVRKYGE